jgi:hypothetical protein
MPFTIKTMCANKEQEITFEDDGALSMPGYDPMYEEAMAEFTGGEYKFSLCHCLYKDWDEIADGVMERLVGEIKKTYYDEHFDRYGYVTSRKVRPFNQGDLACILAEILADLVKDEGYSAVVIASIIGGMNLKLDMCPDIEVEEGSERDHGLADGVYRVDTHTLKVCDVEIANWERMIERRINDFMYFGSDVEDLSDQMDGYPSELVQEVINALGIADSDPDPPKEFDTPKHDESGEGVFGVLYEELIYESGKRPHERDVCNPEVVIYDDESIAKEAAELSNAIERNWGEEYRITLVRRMSPSELEEQRVAAVQREFLRKQHRLFDGSIEAVPEPDPIYTQWTELEEDEDDRPEDFEG